MRVDRARQVMHETLIYEELDDKGVVLSRTHAPLVRRWFHRYEMEHLLGLAGFKVEALHGDFARGPWRPGGDQVWLARRA